MAKKIYNNTTRHVIIVGKSILLPGSNAVDEIDTKKFPHVEKLVEGGFLKIMEDAAEAVTKANTQKAVEEIVKTAPNDEKVKTAAGKRKKQLDAIDKEAESASNGTEVGEG